METLEAKTRATVVVLKKGDQFCLSRKKQSIHHNDGVALSGSFGTYNGYGGKEEPEDGGDMRVTAVRELFAESSVIAQKEDLIEIGRIFFFWKESSLEKADMEVTFYLLETWTGEPKETAEMGPPEFFSLSRFPFQLMMPADEFLFSEMLRGKMLYGKVHSWKKKEELKEFFIPMKL